MSDSFNCLSIFKKATRLLQLVSGRSYRMVQYPYSYNIRYQKDNLMVRSHKIQNVTFRHIYIFDHLFLIWFLKKW